MLMGSLNIQEDDMMHKPEMKLDIPEQLKGLLVDDWENVTKTQKVQLTRFTRTYAFVVTDLEVLII